MHRLIDEARSAVPAGLISAALQASKSVAANHITITINDPMAADLDVLGNNEYIGWYTRQPADADGIEWVSKYDKPSITSEFGGDARFAYHGDAATRWTKENQESLYGHRIAMWKRISFLRGTTPWILMDFRSLRRTLPGIEDYFNRNGLVSSGGEKRRRSSGYRSFIGNCAARRLFDFTP